MKCPCLSKKLFSECCEPFIKGNAYPETAEQLMRSRYTAYTLADMNYLKKTLAPKALEEFDEVASMQWAKSSKWKGLKILKTEDGGPEDKTGTVEFMADYEKDGEEFEHHEVSKFKRNKHGHWLFVDGQPPDRETYVREQPKVGRNEPCPCGSGKKFKKCCAA